jgi:hypothetical protein
LFIVGQPFRHEARSDMKARGPRIKYRPTTGEALVRQYFDRPCVPSNYASHSYEGTEHRFAGQFRLNNVE